MLFAATKDRLKSAVPTLGVFFSDRFDFEKL